MWKLKNKHLPGKVQSLLWSFTVKCGGKPISKHLPGMAESFLWSNVGKAYKQAFTWYGNTFANCPLTERRHAQSIKPETKELSVHCVERISYQNTVHSTQYF